jgi:hypothetical protein
VRARGLRPRTERGARPFGPPARYFRYLPRRYFGEARVICAALEDIAGALVEGGVELPGNGAKYCAAVTRILTALSALGGLVLTVVVIMAED